MTHGAVTPRPLPPAGRVPDGAELLNASHRALLLGDEGAGGGDPVAFLVLLSRATEARRPTVGRWFDPAALCRPLPRLSFDPPRASRRDRRARRGGAPAEDWRGRT